MSIELQNALMRAEAAEALLEELRQECETLRHEVDELRAAQKPPSTKLSKKANLFSSMYGGVPKAQGSDWDWFLRDDKKPPRQSVPDGALLNLSLQENPANGEIRMSIEVGDTGAQCVIDREGFLMHGRSYVHGRVKALLQHIGGSPAEQLIEQVTDEFHPALAAHFA